MNTLLPLPDLRFKGERRYIQGPDLFNTVETVARAEVGPEAWVQSATMREMATGPVALASASAGEEALGTFTVRVGEDSSQWSLVPLEQAGMTLVREPYDEQPVFDRTRLQHHRADFEGPMPHSTMETITSMAKMLHTEQLPVQGAKWIWVGVTLAEPLPARPDAIAVVIGRVLGQRLTRSRLVLDGADLGSLTFAANMA